MRGDTIFLSAFLLIFSSVYAQSNPLTLKKCIQTALENSSKIMIAKRSLTTVQLEVKDAKAGYLPRLDASFGYKVNNTYDKYRNDSQVFLMKSRLYVYIPK